MATSLAANKRKISAKQTAKVLVSYFVTVIRIVSKYIGIEYLRVPNGGAISENLCRCSNKNQQGAGCICSNWLLADLSAPPPNVEPCERLDSDDQLERCICRGRHSSAGPGVVVLGSTVPGPGVCGGAGFDGTDVCSGAGFDGTDVCDGDGFDGTDVCDGAGFDCSDTISS